MNKFLYFAFLLLVYNDIYAQTDVTKLPHVDILYLKDGSILRGKILQIIPDKETKIQILGDSLQMDIPACMIKKLVQEFIKPATMKSSGLYEFRENGWYGFVGVHATPFRISPAYAQPVIRYGRGINAAVGYQFNRLLGVGIGVGAEQKFKNEGDVMVYINADLRGYFLQKKLTPFYSLGLGYGFPQIVTTDFLIGAKGNMYVHPAVGIRFSGGSGVNMTLDLGYRLQQIRYDYEETWRNDIGRFYSETWIYNRIALRLGICF